MDMRSRSGAIDSKDPLAVFVYVLMRDYLPPGRVEDIVQLHIEKLNSKCEFNNGWLANYAIDIATRIKSQVIIEEPPIDQAEGRP